MSARLLALTALLGVASGLVLHVGTMGATTSSDTAHVVILVDRVDRVSDAVRIGRRALTIACQSVLLGIGASLIAMGFAAAGLVPPVMGRPAPGSDRRRRHPQCPPCAARLSQSSVRDGEAAAVRSSSGYARAAAGAIVCFPACERGPKAAEAPGSGRSGALPTLTERWPGLPNPALLSKQKLSRKDRN